MSGIEGQVNKAATLWLKGVFQHLSTGEVRNATLVYVRQLGHPPTARMGYPSQPTFKSIARSKSNGVKAKHATLLLHLYSMAVLSCFSQVRATD